MLEKAASRSRITELVSCVSLGLLFSVNFCFSLVLLKPFDVKIGRISPLVTFHFCLFCFKFRDNNN